MDDIGQYRFLKAKGLTVAGLEELKRIGHEMMLAGVNRERTPIGAFNQQRNNAIRRNVSWQLTLGQWWRIWQRSGKWDQRGKAHDEYVMCRFKDTGPYSADNVFIQTAGENVADARRN